MTTNNPTDTNQASEDELRAEILTEFKQVHKLAPPVTIKEARNG